MENSPSEILSAWISAIDIAFPDCSITEKLYTAAKVLQQASNNLSGNEEPTPIMLNGSPITQEQFNAIYKGYGEYAIAKDTYKNFRTSLLVTFKHDPDAIDKIIKLLLNIKES